MADKSQYDEIRELYAEVDRAYRVPWAIAFVVLLVGILISALIIGP